MPTKTLHKEITDEYTAVKAYREKYVEPRWKETVELVVPKYGVFGPDPEWADARYDTIGSECSALLGDGMFGNLSPANSPWFRYQFERAELNEGKDSAGYLEDLTEHMMQVFNRSTYYDVGPEFLQIGNSIATGTMDIREQKGEARIICSIEHPRSAYCKVDVTGKVTTVYIRKYWTAEQAAEEVGENNLDEPLRKALAENNVEEYEFIECVRPREKWNPKSLLAKEWQYGEYIFRIGDTRETFLSEGGFKEFPKPVWRWSVRGNEPYGWGLVDDVMPDIRTCNQMVKTMLLAAHRTADPATWLPDEGRSWSTNPGAKNYYRDPNRKPFTIDVGSGFRFDGELLEMFQGRVRKALKVDHFLMLMLQEQEMTAREVVERKREGLTVVSATVGKFETEALDRVHQRFLQIEADGKRLPGYREGESVPDELLGQAIKVEYLGPIPQQQKLIMLEHGIISALESSLPIFKLWPQTLDKVKPQILIDRIWRANAATEEALHNNTEWTALQELKAKQAEEARQAAIRAQVAGRVDPDKAPAPGSPAESMIGETVGR